MARITERWNDRRFTRGRSAVRVFDIDNGPVNEDEARVALAAAPYLITSGSAFPLDTSLKVPPTSIEAAIIQPGYYRLTVPYEGNAIGDSETEALFSRKWQVLPAEILEAEVDADVTYENVPVLTSAKMPYDEIDKRTVNWFRFRMRRYESGADLLQKHLAFFNRWNSDAVTLPRYGPAAAKELLFRSVAQVGTQEEGSSAGVLVEYVFEARPTRSVSFGGSEPVAIHGWHSRRADKGMKALATVEGEARNFDIRPKASTALITEPILLNGHGWPLNQFSYHVVNPDDGTIIESFTEIASTPASLVRESGNGAVFLNYDCTNGPIAFAGLNIAANL